jgi:hypothetical protein
MLTICREVVDLEEVACQSWAWEVAYQMEAFQEVAYQVGAYQVGAFQEAAYQEVVEGLKGKGVRFIETCKISITKNL